MSAWYEGILKGTHNLDEGAKVLRNFCKLGEFGDFQHKYVIVLMTDKFYALALRAAKISITPIKMSAILVSSLIGDA